MPDKRDKATHSYNRGSLSMQSLSMDDVRKVVADVFINDKSAKSENTLDLSGWIVILACALFALILTALLIFVEKIRNRFPANLFIILSAVISLSVSVTTILSILNGWKPVIVLSLTAAIFIIAVITGFTSGNLKKKGRVIFTSISGGLLLVGVVTACLFCFLEQLTIASGVSMSIALAIVIFMTIKVLRFGRFDATFTTALFLAYLLWIEEVGLCLSITQCFMKLNDTQNVCRRNEVHLNFPIKLY
ncbi:unnamed protein product [Heterobilharzia americana]|nr:unnamed protein product [Heterobilharzia americana]